MASSAKPDAGSPITDPVVKSNATAAVAAGVNGGPDAAGFAGPGAILRTQEQGVEVTLELPGRPSDFKRSQLEKDVDLDRHGEAYRRKHGTDPAWPDFQGVRDHVQPPHLRQFSAPGAPVEGQVSFPTKEPSNWGMIALGVGLFGIAAFATISRLRPMAPGYKAMAAARAAAYAKPADPLAVSYSDPEVAAGAARLRELRLKHQQASTTFTPPPASDPAAPKS